MVVVKDDDLEALIEVLNKLQKSKRKRKNDKYYDMIAIIVHEVHIHLNAYDPQSETYQYYKKRYSDAILGEDTGEPGDMDG